MSTKTQKLRVSFVIDAPLVGDFIAEYSDKVTALEIVSLVSVPYSKNATKKAPKKENRGGARPNSGPKPGPNSERGAVAARLFAMFDRADVVTRAEIDAEFADAKPKAVQNAVYYLIHKKRLKKTKAGYIRLAPTNGTAHHDAGN